MGQETMEENVYQKSAEMYAENKENELERSAYFILFTVLLIVVLILSKRLHENPKLNYFLSEAALVLLVGNVVGSVLHAVINYDLANKEEQVAWGDDDDGEGEYDAEDRVYQALLTFSPTTFFMALLPPILFNSGYQLRREIFYRHISPIVMFAIIGTTVSAFTCAFFLYGIKSLGWFSDFEPTLLELLAFGSLIAATDTVSVVAVLQAKRVDPHLYYVVFGESALNDAVALVLFNSFASLLFTYDGGKPELETVWAFVMDFAMEAIGSPALGLLFGFLTALVFKHEDLREHRTLELALFLTCMYIPFMIAEVLHLSGIVTIFFSGLSVRRYVAPNVSKETRRAGKTIFKLAAFLAEVCIFLELGLAFLGFKGSFHWQFIAWALLACLLARAVAVYPLSFLHNSWLECRSPTPPPKPETDVEDASEASSRYYVESVLSGVEWTDSYGMDVSGMGYKTAQKLPPPRPTDKKIPLKMAHILWFAGLRGAVAYACVREFPNVHGHDDEFTAATMAIVLFTIVIMGGATEYMLEMLGIETGVDIEQYLIIWRKEHELIGPVHSFENKYIYGLAVREKEKKRGVSFRRTRSDLYDPSPERHAQDNIEEVAYDACTLVCAPATCDSIFRPETSTIVEGSGMSTAAARSRPRTPPTNSRRSDQASFDYQAANDDH